MFQREVAERIVATPAERADYGRLGVLAGWRTQARILFDVPPAAFTPPPKVTSSVVELIPRPAPDPCDARDSLRPDPGGLRPAAQDAAPVAEGLRRLARPRPQWRSSPRQGSSRPCGRRRSRSPASPRLRGRAGCAADLAEGERRASRSHRGFVGFQRLTAPFPGRPREQAAPAGPEICETLEISWISL